MPDTLPPAATEDLSELIQELRRLTGLSTSFFRAAAAKVGLTVADLLVLDALVVLGSMPAGALAELTGTTTGAVTGLINRLEEAGLVRREPDPRDGRKVLVRLAPAESGTRDIDAVFTSISREWENSLSQYDSQQLSLLLEFLKASNSISAMETQRMRYGSAFADGVFADRLGEVRSGKLSVVFSGLARVAVIADDEIAALYQARFEGPIPDVKVKDGEVDIRYPKSLVLVGAQNEAEIKLNRTIPWDISLQGGASMIKAELGGLDLSSLVVKGGMNMVDINLPMPKRIVPLRLSGAASDIHVWRPTGTPARAHFKGWVSEFVFDGRHFSNIGNDAEVQSPDYLDATVGYEIEVESSASMVTIEVRAGSGDLGG